MNDADVKDIPELKSLQILEADHPAARSLTDPTSAHVIAEAKDTIRLFELLKRSEYQALAAVRFKAPDSQEIRVYFQLLDRDE